MAGLKVFQHGHDTGTGVCAKNGILTCGRLIEERKFLLSSHFNVLFAM